MDAWNTLVNTALLGTEKRNSSPGLVSALTGADAGVENDPEATFLRDTALLSAYRRGGMEPLRYELSSEPAAPETRPYAGSASDGVLAEILDAGNPGLLRLWLEAARRQGQLVPPRHLDRVLDTTTRAFNLHPLVRETAGARGAWIATLNPKWAWLSGQVSSVAWDTGTSVERSAYLQQLRHTDPDHARELLEQTWEKESADQRERLLGILETGIGAADLGFVERAAGDRSKRVTAQALELLMRVRGSSIVQGFEGWLRGAVHMQADTSGTGAGKTLRIIIETPDIADERLAEAVGKKPPTGIGAEQFRFQRISSHVPPEFWETQLQQTPETIVELLREAAPEVFPDALAASAALFGTSAWAVVLANAAERFYPALIPLLETEMQQDYLARFATKHPDQVLEYYGQNDEEWHPTVAPKLLAQVASQPYQYNKQYLITHAWRIPLQVLSRLEEITPRAGSGPDHMRNYAVQVWPSHRQALRDALELKARILQSFT